MNAPRPPPTHRRLMLAGGLLVLAVALSPFLAAGGLGRLVGSLWVSTMGAVFALIGGILGH